MTGPEFKHILKYNEEKSDAVHNRPFVIKDPSLTTAEQINTERKKQKLGFLSKSIGKLQKHLKDKYGEGNDKIRFLMNHQGLIILRGDYRLMAKKQMSE